MPGITFTLDLEHHWYSDEPNRFVGAADELLALTDRLGVRGTVFVLGQVATSHPAVVAAWADAGHEIALHGYAHTPLPELDATAVRADIERGQAVLQDLTGRPVVGYRAPYFSLVPGTEAVADVLGDLGFTYSSSVLPTANPQFGWPGAPNRPFAWPSGVVELPVNVAAVGPIGLPFLGGTYLRVLPPPVVRLATARMASDALLWTYCHPYDLDAAEPYRTIPQLGAAQSRLLWIGRRSMVARLERMLRDGGAPPLAERVAAGVGPLAGAPT